MNQKLKELYEISLAAIYGEGEMPDGFGERLSVLSDEEKMEVARAIHNYSRDNVPLETRERLSDEVRRLDE
jgi:hypothetical protein